MKHETLDISTELIHSDEGLPLEMSAFIFFTAVANLPYQIS